MNGFYQKNTIQNNISPMNVSQKQIPYNFPMQFDKKLPIKNNNTFQF
jgi:hypothetical protein